jgi:hypothetical protein
MRNLLFLPIALVCLAGCGGPSLVGKWNVSGDKKLPAGANTVIEFTSDKFTQTTDFMQMRIRVHFDIIGTYTFDGKKLKRIVTDMKLDDSQIPSQFKEMARSQFSVQADAVKGKVEEIEVKLDGDTATLTQKDGTITLTRIK